MKQKKHIQGFKVPKGYFKKFDEELFAKLSEENIPSRNGFKVPDGYFNEIEEKILQQIEEKKHSPKVISLKNYNWMGYAAAIAACVVLIFSLNINNGSSIETIDQLPYANVKDYIEDGNIDINTYDILALLDDEDIQSITFNNDMLSAELLEDYLVENMDETTLNEEK